MGSAVKGLIFISLWLVADDDRVLRIAVNDVIVRHDALWPRGLNELLYVQTPLEVAELRLSCLRHRWPPADADLQPCDAQLNLPRLRARLQQQVVAESPPGVTSSTGNGVTSGATAVKKGAGGAPRGGSYGRPQSTSTIQHTSPTKSAQQQQQSTKSPTNRRPTTTTKSNTASSPTKTPRGRPQSAPKPPPAATSSRPPQPSAATPHSRPKSAKSMTAGGDGSGPKPSRSTAGRVAAASAETQSTSTLDTMDTSPSVNGASLSEPHDNTQHIPTSSTAESSDHVISTVQNEPHGCATVVGCPEIPATV